MLKPFKSLRPQETWHKTHLIHDVYEHAQDNFPSSIEEEEFQEHRDLEPPTDGLLDFITSQEHSEDQLDLLKNF